MSHHLFALVCEKLAPEDGHIARLVSKGLRDAVDDARRPLMEPVEACAAKACTSVARVDWLLQHVGMSEAWTERIAEWGALCGSVDVVRWAWRRGRPKEQAVVSAAVKGGSAPVLAWCLDEAYPHDGVHELLLDVSKLGHAPCIEVLLGRGAHVDHADRDGWTALLVACWEGRVKVVRTLLKNAADVNKAKVNNGATPLCMASYRGHVEVLAALLNHRADVDKARTDDGTTPLFMASQEGHVEAMQVILKHGADVDKGATDGGATPLLMASQNGHVDVVQVLVGHMADVNKATSDGAMAPLYMASQNGHADVVETLLVHKADPNKAMADTGSTPLLMASQNGHVAVVQLLLKFAAAVDKATWPCATHAGATPLLMASQKGHVDVVQVLLKHCADVDKPEAIDGASPVFLASLNGHEQAARLLLDNGARVDRRMHNGWTPLMSACRGGSLACAKLMRAQGVPLEAVAHDVVVLGSPDQVHATGFTALIAACESGSTSVVRFLLETKVDVNHAVGGRSPLSWAAVGEHEDVVELLRESGAEG